MKREKYFIGSNDFTIPAIFFPKKLAIKKIVITVADNRRFGRIAPRKKPIIINPNAKGRLLIRAVKRPNGVTFMGLFIFITARIKALPRLAIIIINKATTKRAIAFAVNICQRLNGMATINSRVPLSSSPARVDVLIIIE